QWLSLSILTPLSIIGFFSISKNRKLSQIQIVTIPESKIHHQQFFEDIYITTKNNQVRFLSAKCSHLGCHINKLKNDELICPCHGSKFTVEGKVIQGPANKNLHFLAFEYIAEEKKYLVYKST
ncbi:MAG: Rieske 2Fe-2S domain-containing protein, partial [Bacteroidales bacterium]|nr:Rieske 2Fe-2S domain-containing protein [Bacteroidales bacterium]